MSTKRSQDQNRGSTNKKIIQNDGSVQKGGHNSGVSKIQTRPGPPKPKKK